MPKSRYDDVTNKYLALAQLHNAGQSLQVLLLNLNKLVVGDCLSFSFTNVSLGLVLIIYSLFIKITNTENRFKHMMKLTNIAL